jgi:hypothetical protein
MDHFAAAKAVADTVLYEGYVLYPYRASAAKNQVRWQFGVLAPEAVAAAVGERSTCRTECLLQSQGDATIEVRLRFLQVEARQVQASTADGDFTPVASLETGGRIHTTFEGGIEHEIDLEVAVRHGAGRESRQISLPSTTDAEPVIGDDGKLAGRIVSERRALEATLSVDVARVGDGALSRVRVDVENVTRWDGDPSPARALLVRQALVGVHTLLAGRGAGFVSLLDPPAGAEAAAAACASDGTYPVLVGVPGEEVVLSSPIILPEHPEVAPESAGDFCDATEIDEILALRVLTLTDEEKREARSTDPRAAAIVDRCDGLPEELLSRLHGAIRSLRPASAEPEPDPFAAESFPVIGTPTGDEDERPWWDPAVDGSVDPWTDTLVVDGVPVGKGAKVRLRPGRRADAQDLFLAGMAATVQGVFSDVDGNTHVAVTVDADPGADLSIWHGRFLYFHPEEIEPQEGAS